MTTEQAILGTITDPHINAIANIKITNGWLCKLQDNFFKDYQLTHQQYNILRILKGQHPRGVSIMDIKKRMVDKMSNVGRLVEKLQQKGFAERLESLNDRRVVFVHLTDKGIDLLAEILMNFDTMHGYFDNITDEESRELVRILEKMRKKTISKVPKKVCIEVLEEA
jgi:DNA-binding MarR family transcriptional regulator